MPSLNELLANPSMGRSYGLYRFTNLALAKDSAYRSGSYVVLGNEGTYFVTSARLAHQLVKVGYEWA